VLGHQLQVFCTTDSKHETCDGDIKDFRKKKIPMDMVCLTDYEMAYYEMALDQVN
jgi:hypothetical protein